MANKYLIVFFTIICCMCGFVSAAHAADDAVIIPENLRQQCAEYVAVKYTDAYVKSLDKTKGDYKRYVEKFGTDVGDWSIEDTDKIRDYLNWFSDSENEFTKTNSQLTSAIKDRRCETLEELLSISTESYQSRCYTIKEKLKNELTSFVGKSQQHKEESRATHQSGKPVRENRGQKHNSEGFLHDNLIWIVGGLSVINTILLIVVFCMVAKVNHDYIVETILDSHRIEERFGHTGNVQLNVSSYDGMKQQLDTLIRNYQELKRELSELKNAAPVKQVIIPESQIPTNAPKNSVAIVFAKNYGRGILKECDESKAQYKIYIENGGLSKFEFFGNFEHAKSNPDATFDGVCQQQGNLNKANSCQTVQKGDAVRDGDNWKVVKQAVINFS